MNKDKIGIIGLGYVGAPLAYLSAVKGYSVIGIDSDEKVIEKINKRLDVPEQLCDKCNKMNLIATSDYSLLSKCNIVIVCIPTPTKNNKPDLTIMKSVLSNMSNFINKGCLLIIESTVAPGMTRKYVEEYLKENANLNIDKDYDLAYCPERIDPGNKKYWIGNINRVCGGCSRVALNRAYGFYSSIIEAKVLPLESIEEAELIKVWENSMRNISIAQANLLAMACDKYGFSVNRIIKGLESKIEQFGNKLAYPGIGPGGHCIPEDIHYLIETSEENINLDMGLLKEAVNINENMPQYVYNKLVETVNKDGNDFNKMDILMLGTSYKANSRDMRRSQAIVLYDIIKKSHNNNFVYDPIVEGNIDKLEMNSFLNERMSKTDIVVIGCPHDIFIKIDYTKYKNIKYILDCWNKLNKESIINAGINYIGVGI